jgi:uncharacterized membrane protein
MSVFEKGLITILICDSIFVLIAIPLLLRKVPRNVVYGFRTRTTLADDFVWYEANAHFGRGLVIASLISAIVVLIFYRTQYFSGQQFLTMSIIALVVPSLIAALATGRHVRSLKAGGG